MKYLLLLFVLFSFTVVGQHEHKPTASTPVDTLKKSIPKEVHAQVGDTHMMMYYHAPAVRGRMIFGGLVAYDEVWVTGAHSATSWEFNTDIVINNVKIPSGKYAFFTIPGKEKWIVIINRNWEQHLADDYSSADDVMRIEVIPQRLDNTQERLNYSISAKTGEEGEISMSWEKVKIVVPFRVN